VNGVTSGTIDLYQQSGGAGSLASPILVIFAVPNNTTGTLLTSINVGATATLDNSSGTAIGTESVTFGVIPLGTEFGDTGAGLVGGTAGFQSYLSNGQEVYGTLGIGEAQNNSESFANFQAADLAAAGITVPDTSQYGLYVFSLDTNDFAGQDFLQLTINDIPQGTFIVGYGQDGITTCISFRRDGSCKKYSDYKAYSTPFTEAGLTNVPPVPEPASWILLGSGLVLIGYVWRRMRMTASALSSAQ
jgi:hypothetical protein